MIVNSSREYMWRHLVVAAVYLNRTFAYVLRLNFALGHFHVRLLLFI